MCSSDLNGFQFFFKLPIGTYRFILLTHAIAACSPHVPLIDRPSTAGAALAKPQKRRFGIIRPTQLSALARLIQPTPRAPANPLHSRIFMPDYRSKTSTHGRNMAGARALWRATGVMETDFGKPIIAVANSFTQFVPGC